MSGKNIDFLFSLFFLSAIISYSYMYYSSNSYQWPNSQFYVIITISSLFLLYLIILNFKDTKLLHYEIIMTIFLGIGLGYSLQIFENSSSYSSHVSYLEFLIAMILIIFLVTNNSSRFDEADINTINSVVITLIVIQLSELIGWVVAGIGLEIILTNLIISSFMLLFLFYYVKNRIRILPPIIRGFLLGLLQFIHINGNVNFIGSQAPTIILISLFLFTITEQFNSHSED